MARRIYSGNSRQTRRRSRRTDRSPGDRSEEAEDAAAGSSTRPERNTDLPWQPILTRTVRTVRRPKCARRKRWSRHRGAAGAARVSPLLSRRFSVTLVTAVVSHDRLDEGAVVSVRPGRQLLDPGYRFATHPLRVLNNQLFTGPLTVRDATIERADELTKRGE